MRPIFKTIASGLGVGYCPVAPGTAGSALAVLLAWLLRESWSVPVGLMLSGTALMVGIVVCGIVERDWGHDDRRMVIDEVAGQWLTLAAVPLSAGTAAAGFLIFRFLDIIKPPPARAAERLPGGWGVMADDVVAGALGAVILWGMVRWMW
jgi:phosphatidylglycerophosphatase A